MRVRLDKWLQVARVFKTRSQATKACNLSRVRVNGQVVKPHRSVTVGDRVGGGAVVAIDDGVLMLSQSGQTRKLTLPG